MISWYIEVRQGATHKDSRYLDKVKEVVTPCMEHFCNRLNDAQFTNIVKDILFTEMKNIIEELPFLTFKCHEDNFYIIYNRDVDIMFNDGLKSIIRDIKLSKILTYNF